MRSTCERTKLVDFRSSSRGSFSFHCSSFQDSMDCIETSLHLYSERLIGIDLLCNQSAITASGATCIDKIGDSR